jgi:hypothetical protein
MSNICNWGDYNNNNNNNNNNNKTAVLLKVAKITLIRGIRKQPVYTLEGILPAKLLKCSDFLLMTV